MNTTFAKNAKELVIMGGYVDLNLLQVTSRFNQDLGSDINFKPAHTRKVNYVLELDKDKLFEKLDLALSNPPTCLDGRVVYSFP
jgi:hypothetical protein